MKKIVSLVLAMVLALSLAACGKTTVTLDKSEHTFTAAGETVQLTANAKADSLAWSSSDESVATVDATGLVTAVAPGTATITVTAGDVSASCTVTCKWETVVDINLELDAFFAELYETLYPVDEEGYATGPAVDDWAAMEEIPEILTTYYPGLFDLELKQVHIYIPMMSAVAYEVALIEAANDADVETIKGILQARIDTQVNNHHNYPMVIEAWQNNAHIVTYGRYLMLVVGDDAAAYVDAFSAQF